MWSKPSIRCRANMAHLRQSRPASGLGFQVKVPKNVLSCVPSSLGAAPSTNGPAPQPTLARHGQGIGISTHTPLRCRAKGQQLERLSGLSPESQVLNVLYVPSSVDMAAPNPRLNPTPTPSAGALDRPVRHRVIACFDHNLHHNLFRS